MNTGTALTLTYKRHVSVEPLVQFQTTILQVIKLLAKSCDHFEVYPELTIDGNIHYHLIVNIKDKIKWYKQVIPTFKKNGYTKIKKIFKIETWRKYCNKDLENMIDILSTCSNMLPITNKNYKKYITKTKQTLQEEITELDGILKYYYKDNTV